jgi:hypothetical protein
MPDEKVMPTHDEFRATFKAVRQKIGRMDVCRDATIDDYSIGRRERGKFRLEFERTVVKGYRTVRTRTNKFCRWCAPMKSLYRISICVVVRACDDEHQAVWLAVANPADQRGVNITIESANGKGNSLAQCCRNDAPRRAPRTSTTSWTKSKLSIAGPFLARPSESIMNHR